jgi:hypothetical protein
VACRIAINKLPHRDEMKPSAAMNKLPHRDEMKPCAAMNKLRPLQKSHRRRGTRRRYCLRKMEVID